MACTKNRKLVPLWTLALLALVFMALLFSEPSFAAKKKKKLKVVCGPQRKTNKAKCKAKMAVCEQRTGFKLKWTGTGCKIGRKLAGDGGCQCDQYCGYRCPTACNSDSQCHWMQNQCVNRLSRLPTGPMVTCYQVTSQPSSSPTTSQPSTSPTTSVPSVSPTMAPSYSPTTSSPSFSPTTSTPTSSPSFAPSGAPTPPTHAPSAAPTMSAPSVAPTTKEPTASPTFSQPTSNPTTSAPSKSPTTPKPSLSPVTSRPSNSPTTRKPTTLAPTKKATKSPTTKVTTVCSTCRGSTTCVQNTCIGRGNLQVTMTWNRPGQMQMWVYPPQTGTWIGEDNPNMPNANSASGQQDKDKVYGTGPNNVFWALGKTPPGGVYKVCALTWFFDPYPSPSHPVEVRVDILRSNGGKTVLTGTIDVDSYWETSPECFPKGTTSGQHSFGYYIGSFTV